LDTVADMRVLDHLALPLGSFPVLVMTATNADPGNKENQAYWLRISPSSRQVVITGSHNLDRDDPVRVTSEIIRTLDDIRKAG
jgi:pimeloyl-ACP methyl ester carboxylesterase